MSDLDSHPAMSTPVEADLQQYGAISPLAIGALLLGLVSFLATFSLLLLVVPVVAALVALFALRQIQASDGALIGRTPAMVGLVAALLFASIAVSSVVSRNRMLESQAVTFARDWVTLVRSGEMHRAHQLHLSASDRQLPSASLEEFYEANAPAQDDFNRFVAQPLVESIRRLDADTTFRTDVVETTVYDKMEQLAVRFQSTEDEEHVDFVLVVERATTDDGGVWRVMAISEPKEQK